MKDIEFTTRPLNVREMLLVQMVVRNRYDLEAIVSLLCARSGMPASIFLEMSVETFAGVVERLYKSIDEATNVMALLRGISMDSKSD